MATELQRQISHIRSKQVSSEPVHKGRPSLFLSPKEAAEVDVEDIYQAAFSALVTLQQHDDRLIPFTEKLFHPSSVKLQRELKTSEDNKALDKDLNSLLSILALFSSEKPSHLILEYLIRRYRIHALNVDSLLRCVLPICDSKIFARVVQLSAIEGTVWAFLDGVKKSGAPLPRTVLAREVRKNNELLSICRSLTQSAISLASHPTVRPFSASQSGAERVISFFTNLIFEVCGQSGPLPDSHLRTLFPYFRDGFVITTSPDATMSHYNNNAFDLWRKSSCVVLTKLSQSLRFSDALSKNVVEVLTESFYKLNVANDNGEDFSEAIDEITCTLIAILAQQSVPLVPAALRTLVMSAQHSPGTYLLIAVDRLKSSHDTGVLISWILKSIVSILLGPHIVQDARELTQLVQVLLSRQLVSETMVTESIETILHAVASLSTASVEDHQVVGLVKGLAKRFPQLFDASAAKVSLDFSGDGSEQSFRSVLNSIFSTQLHLAPAAQSLSLLLALGSVSAEEKISALNIFCERIPEDPVAGDREDPDVLGLCHAALACQQSEQAHVAVAAWRPDICVRLCRYLGVGRELRVASEAISDWSRLSIRSLSECASVVQRILQALSSDKVLQATYESAEELEHVSGLKYSPEEWLLSLVLTNSSSVLNSKYATLTPNVKVAAAVSDISGAALGLAIGLSTRFALLAGFKSSPETNLTSSIALSLSQPKSRKNGVEFLHKISSQCLIDFQLSAQDSSLVSVLEVSVAFVDALKAVPEALPGAGQVLAGTIQLILKVFEQEETFSSREIVLTLFSKCIDIIEVSGLFRSNIEIGSSVLDVSNALTREFQEDNLGFSVIFSLLGSSSPGLLPYLGPSLRAFFPSSAVFPLLAVAFSPNETLSSCTQAKVNALHSLAAWIDSLSATKRSGRALAQQESSFLLLSALLIVTASCDANPGIRKAAIALAAKIEHVGCSIVANVGLTSPFTAAHAPSVKDLIEIGRIIKLKSFTITADSQAAVTILSRILFSSGNGEIKADLGLSIQKTLLVLAWTLVESGLRGSEVVFVLAGCGDAQVTWPFVHNIISAKKARSSRVLDAIFDCIRTSQFAPLDTQKAVVEWIVSALQSSESDVEISNRIIGLISNGWVSSLKSDQLKQLLFHALTFQLLHVAGHDSGFEAITNIQVRPQVWAAFLDKEVKDFQSHGPSSGVDADMLGAGLSGAFQVMCTTLELLLSGLRVSFGLEADHFSVSCVASRLFDLLRLTSDYSYESTFGLEYLRSLIIDLSLQCVELSGKKLIGQQTVAVKSRKSKGGRGKGSEEEDASGLNEQRLSEDIGLILKALNSNSSQQVVSAALNLIKELVLLSPSCASLTSRALGEMLAAPSYPIWFIEEVLKVLLHFQGRQPDGNAAMIHQDIFQYLFFCFSSLTVQNRRDRITRSLEVLGPESLSGFIGPLLVQVLTAYDSEPSDASVEGGVDSFVLLSLAAQRKARKALKTSACEEIFSLAVKTSVRFPVEVQFGNLILLIKTCGGLLDQVVEGDSSRCLSTFELDSAAMAIDSSKLVQYAVEAHSKLASDEVSRQGLAATLLLLVLEFAFEILENRDFHSKVATFSYEEDSDNEEGSDSQKNSLQTFLLQFCDQLLQLHANASQVLLDVGSKPKTSISVTFPGGAILVRLGALSRNISSRSLDLLKSTQQYLDVPAFVSIFQELVDHHDTAVRQKALQMLGQRMESLENSNALTHAECSLFLELAQHLRGIVGQVVSCLEIPKKSSKKKSAAPSPSPDTVGPSQRIGLSQSALLCLDSLTRHIGKSKNAEIRGLWAPLCADLLKDSLSLHNSLNQFLEIELANVHFEGSGGIDLIKLMGSNFLMCGTCCQALGPKALTNLATLVQSITGAIENYLQIFRTLDTEDGTSVSRAFVLLFRSALSSLAMIVSNLPAFCHPHLKRILSSALSLHDLGSLAGAASVASDVQRCLSLVLAKIPPRLSIPALLNCVGEILSAGPVVAEQLAHLLAELWCNLDRSTVVTYLKDLFSTSLICLDYRQVYGISGTQGVQTEESIVNSVAQLCLKLTETELKGLIIHMSEWRDFDFDSDEVSDGKRISADEVRMRHCSRSCTFYSLIATLCVKLKSIFVPCMGIVWTNMIESVSEFTSLINSDSSNDKSGKKRKVAESAAGIDCATNPVIALQKDRTVKILESIALTCSNDTINFIDEQKYTSLMPSLVEVLGLRNGFSDDLAYLAFCQEHLLPSLAGIAVAVGKDILWKPMNHKVLLLCRDKRKSVRLAALSALKFFFQEIGEEYLALLPECLPFLSELLEDDADEVAALAAEVIRGIEELSGESLDSYLQ